MQERQRVSTESSRVSFSSSSHLSSFSSPEGNRASAQLEQSSFDKMIFSETSSRDTAMSLQSLSPQFTQPSIDLRDFVKDSMYREIQALSAKPKSIESKISDDTHGTGLEQQREQMPTDLKESLRALEKLREVSTHHNEPRELFRSSSCHFKDGSSFTASRDVPPWFSYDGRDMIDRTPFDSGDVSKSSIKLKNLPRLSLDSRDGKHIPGNQTRPPSVVVKLMGLEMLLDSAPCDYSSSGSRRVSPDEEFVNISSSLEKTEQIKSKSSWKEPTSPCWRSPDSSMKPMAKFPIEPAPWEQIDGWKGSQKPVTKSTKDLAKASATFPSVYSEIEKRLKDLEFNQSGKDLRALKQILEAMQAKGLLEARGQDSNFASHGDKDRVLLGSTRLVDGRRLEVTSSQNHESPIVIMKPVKLVEKSIVPTASEVLLNDRGRTTKDQIFKSSKRANGLNPDNKMGDKPVKTAPSSMRSQQLSKEVNAGVGKSSESISPKMLQKKAELEKRLRPPTSPDSGRLPRQLPGGRRRMKHQSHQKTDDQMSHEVSVQSRHLTPQENKVSDLCTVRGSKNCQVNSSERSPINSARSPSSAKASKFRLLYLKSTLTINEEESVESGSVPPEYSSPVSVLENVLCKGDSPSLSKYTRNALKVEASAGDDGNSSVVSVNSFAPISTESGAAFEINRKKLQNIENLVQKLQGLNSTHDEARTDYIASLCENNDPDHRYVSELLLASSLLLRDLTDFQFHLSGHPINPELFFVLEQTKVSKCSKGLKPKSTADKAHRKLIFDVCNEILAGKLAPTGLHSEPWIRPVKLARKMSNGQKLLRELCHEIEGLWAKNSKCCHDVDEDDDSDTDDWRDILYEDVMHRLDHWMEFPGEVLVAVLDIEWLIFKDLVNEIVMGESAGLVVGRPRTKVPSRK